MFSSLYKTGAMTDKDSISWDKSILTCYKDSFKMCNSKKKEMIKSKRYVLNKNCILLQLLVNRKILTITNINFK